MSMKWYCRAATDAERKFAFSCDDGDEVCKCIGHLRADFGNSGREFWTTWWEHKHPELKTQAFRDALDETINRMRREDKEFSPLKSRSAMSKFCYDYPEAREGEVVAANSIFRVDVLGGEHSFLMRMNPAPGFYNLYCYCYRTEDLEGGLA